jgi:hypothetical protein
MSEVNDAAKAALDDIKASEGNASEDNSSGDTDNTSDIETQAADMGWTPEGVEGKRNLTAEEFVDRQGLYTDIKNLKKSNKKLQDGLDATLKMQDGIRERERAKVIKELHAEKKEALEEENYDKVIKIDEDLATARAEATTDVPNRAFDGWVEDNPWYRSNTEMQQFADMMGAGINQANDKLPMADVYAKVRAEVEKRFPEEFETGNAARRRQSAVEGAGQGRQGAGGGGKPTRYSVADLPAQDREIMKTVRRATGMSEQDYLKSYFGQ